jgi:hypothetical protein
METQEVKKEFPGQELITAVTQLLVDAGHPEPMFWIDNLHRDAVMSEDFDKRRFQINRQWEMIFGSVSPAKVDKNYMRDQLDARYCLLPQGNVKEWLKSFKDGVVPTVMKYQIPMQTR